MLFLIIALAVPPLAGSAGFVMNDVTDARADRDLAVEVRDEIGEVIMLFDLRIDLVEEYTWELVMNNLDTLGLEPADVVRLLRIDPVAELAAARTATSRSAEQVGDRALLDVVQEFKSSDPDLLEFYEIQARGDFEVTIRINALLSELRSKSGSIRRGEQTAAAIETLRIVGDVQRSMASGSINMFSSTPLDSAVTESGRSSRRGLLSDIASFDTARTQFAGQVPSPAVAEMWSQIEASPASMRYLEQIEQQLSTIVNDEASGVALPPNLVEIVSLFSDANEVIAAYTELIDVAADDVRDLSGRIADEADADANATIRSLAILVSITIAFALFIALLIVRPSRRLATGATRIEQGDTTHRIPERGPTELRDAARALNGATATLHLVEQQARQMATGALAADEVTKATQGPLGDSLRSAIETLAGSIAEREQLRTELAHEASHDGLTGLPNRTAVLERLDEAVGRAHRNDHHVAVMFLDLDGFKAVNDEHGHAVGDTVLTTIARRFRDAARAGDVIGRLGGDEFLLVAEPVSCATEALAIATRMNDIARRPIHTGTATITVGVSIGVAVTSTHHTTSTDLLHAADEAVYRAKADPDHHTVTAATPDHTVQAAASDHTLATR